MQCYKSYIVSLAKIPLYWPDVQSRCWPYYSHLSNNRGGWNKHVGVQKVQNIESFVMKSINVQGGFMLCRVEFLKIGKRDVTFIRERRVPSKGFIVTTF